MTTRRNLLLALDVGETLEFPTPGKLAVPKVARLVRQVGAESGRHFAQENLPGYRLKITRLKNPCHLTVLSGPRHAGGWLDFKHTAVGEMIVFTPDHPKYDQCSKRQAAASTAFGYVFSLNILPDGTYVFTRSR